MCRPGVDGVFGKVYSPTHYANREAAREPLPENGDSSVRDQQTWSQNQRYTITRYTDYIANEALDDADKAVEAVKELRDRALVYVLAFTGVRGGEILRDPNDEQRRGLRWGDVNSSKRSSGSSRRSATRTSTTGR